MDRMTMKDPRMRRLGPKLACFVIEYIKDYAPRRAAEASGYPADKGYELMQDPMVVDTVIALVQERMEEAGIDATWLLYELADNHRIARQQGNINASNTALKTLMQHVSIDAMAKQRVEVDDVSARELVERLQRGRQRNQTNKEEDTSFL